MYYDYLFSKNMQYILFIVKTQEECKRACKKLKYLGYRPDGVFADILGSILSYGFGYFAIQNGVSFVRYGDMYYGEAGSFCKGHPEWYITTIDDAKIEYNSIDL